MSIKSGPHLHPKSALNKVLFWYIIQICPNFFHSAENLCKEGSMKHWIGWYKIHKCLVEYDSMLDF